MDAIEQANALYIERIKLQDFFNAECERHIKECENLIEQSKEIYNQLFIKK